MFKLSRAFAVNSNTGPVVGPCSVLVCSETDHRLNSEAHAGFGHTDGLVLCVVRDVGCAVEQSVDTVTAVGLDGTATSVLGVLCDDGTVLSEQCVGLCDLDGFVQTLAGSLDDANRIRVGQSLVADVVCFVDIAVEAAVVQSNVNVDDVSILEDTLIGDTVTNGLVDRSADRLGEVAVVQRRGV